MKKPYMILTFLPILIGCHSYSQSQEKAYALHLMNFAKSIQWPAQHNGNSLTIGIISYPPLISELQNIIQSRTTVGGKQVIVKEITSPKDAHDCEILFVPTFKTKSLPEILQSNKGKSTLIVTNTIKPTFGSDINFFLKEGKLSYQINSKGIDTKGIKVPASIKNMGVLFE